MEFVHNWMLEAPTSKDGDKFNELINHNLSRDKTVI